MWGWIWILGMFAFMGVMLWHDNESKPTPEQYKIIVAESTADSLQEVCVKGVVYYFTNGPHNVRLAAAVDETTLQFKRCKG